MIAINILNNLSINNLRFLDAESLNDQRVLDKLLRMSEDPIFDLESAQALQFYEQLNKIFAIVRERLESDPEIYNQITTIILKFFWKALPSMPPKFRANIFSENLVFSLLAGADIKSALQKVLNPFEFNFEPDKEQRRQWIYALENNQEELGNKNLNIQEQMVKPKIQNWLRLYNTSQNLKGEKRSKFNQINFLDKDKNALSLSDEEKQALSKIIDIYDWLLFPLPGPKVVPDEDFSKANSFITLKKAILPVELVKKTTAPKIIDELPTQPVVPNTQISHSEIPRVKTIPKQKMAGLDMGELRQNFENSKLVQDIGQIKKEIEEKKILARKQIDEKLEELRKKTINN
jgi:hypothetical protein